MLLSIIIPTCGKREGGLQRALNSISLQGQHSLEIIVVDDRLHNDSPLIEAESIPQAVKVIRNNGRHGVACARNAGIEVAVGDWVLLLDDDDEMVEGYLHKVVEHITQNPQMDFFWCGINTLYSHKSNKVKAKEICYYNANEALYIGASFGVGIRRSILTEVGLFDEAFEVAEDTEFFIRLVASGALAIPIPLIGIIKHETHKERLSSNYLKYSKERVYEKIFNMHASYLNKNRRTYMRLILWSTKVHYMNKEAQLGREGFKRLFLVLLGYYR